MTSTPAAGLAQPDLARTKLARAYTRIQTAATSRLNTLSEGRLAPWLPPTSIAIGLIDRCNARCVHCNIWRNKGPEDVIPLQVWQRLLGDLRVWLGPVQVTLTGGEALLRAHAIDLVAYGTSIGLLIEHLTHGYWRDQSRVEALARARPWRITMSLDGIGAAHDKVRGRKGFYDVAMRSLATIERVSADGGRPIEVLLKTVIMRHNLHDLANVARFAADHGHTVLYQPIEQNYASGEDPLWHETSDNWPADIERAVTAIKRLIELKQGGFPIRNSVADLETMIAYFRDPVRYRQAVQRHADLKAPQCVATGTLQLGANGDVYGCFSKPPFGNIRIGSIRTIWRNRPQYWREGCCMQGQAQTPAEACRNVAAG